ncbi:CPBP family intramembrane glutamic endopeptidase [Azospirillum sp. A26]|uniref:CPBP family intramembrane glutamic endopeptidase n=1 Tax=Azospirillum sp. A26 TaxID=3160607 RepID=UPI00366EC538
MFLEIIVRGIQASLRPLLTSRYKALEKILLSNMLFSATHLHVSIMPALAVLPLGLCWGWIFARQKPRGVGGGTRLGRDAASLI